MVIFCVHMEKSDVYLMSLVRCDNLTECRVAVGKEALGEPQYCDDRPKYLTVDYTCL